MQDVQRWGGLDEPRCVHTDPRTNEFTDKEPDKFSVEQPDPVTDSRPNVFAFGITFKLPNIFTDKITVVFAKR